MNKTYLGDGVYAIVESGMIKLTTENGIAVQNEIFLEYEVLQNLLEFADKHGFIPNLK